MNVDARVVVELAQLAAFGQLRVALGIGWRRRLLRGTAPATASPSANSRERLDRSAHHFHFAEAVLNQGLECVLSGVDLSSVTVGDASNPHPVDDGVRFARSFCGRFGSEESRGHHDPGCEGCGAAEKGASRGQFIGGNVGFHLWFTLYDCRARTAVTGFFLGQIQFCVTTARLMRAIAEKLGEVSKSEKKPLA